MPERCLSEAFTAMFDRIEKRNKMENKKVVLCGANAYEEKYYLNRQFSGLPTQIQEELQIMCVLYTHEIGGIFLLEFDEDGSLQFCTEAAEDDFSYDEIGSVLKIKELRREKAELLQSLELYYKVVILKQVNPEDLE